MPWPGASPILTTSFRPNECLVKHDPIWMILRHPLGNIHFSQGAKPVFWFETAMFYNIFHRPVQLDNS
jgi:hypothetical protein